MYMHVKSNTSIVTNIIIGISVLTLSLDYANKIIAKVIRYAYEASKFYIGYNSITSN